MARILAEDGKQHRMIMSTLTNHVHLVLLAEKLAKFVKRACRGKRRWHRLPLNSNIVSTEMDCAMPNMGKLFALPDVVARVTLKAAGSCEIRKNGPSRHAMPNRVEEIKAKNGFDNDHLEMSVVRVSQQS